MLLGPTRDGAFTVHFDDLLEGRGERATYLLHILSSTYYAELIRILSNFLS